MHQVDLHKFLFLICLVNTDCVDPYRLPYEVVVLSAAGKVRQRQEEVVLNTESSLIAVDGKRLGM